MHKRILSESVTSLTARYEMSTKASADSIVGRSATACEPSEAELRGPNFSLLLLQSVQECKFSES